MTDIYVVSAFSKNRTGGNKAGVVLQADHLDRIEKTKIASRLGYSETAFMSASGQADFKLEYFTPTGEVPLCGHATIGTFVLLNHLELLKKQVYSIETGSGLLKITIDRNGLVFMEQNLPQFYNILPRIDVESCFHSQRVHDTLPIQIVSTGLRDILLPISTPHDLKNMVPVYEAISSISRAKECVGIHAFSFVQDTDITAVCRNFAPLYGIKEESATGTSNCALACYLYKYGVRKNQYVFEQGHNLNSISRIYVMIESSAHRITGVYAGGTGYLTDHKRI